MKFNLGKLKWKQVFINYVKANSKEYILVVLLFLIGIFLGVMIINNSDTANIEETSQYIKDFIENFKITENINKLNLTTESIKNDIILTIILWLAGTTVIGVPIVLIVITFRGICLGYTISAITYTLGTGKGILFSLITLCLQNVLFIPAVLTLGVSSIKLYKSIIQDRRKENIKIEIIRHTIISIIMSVVLIMSAIVENFISIPILQNSIKYF